MWSDVSLIVGWWALWCFLGIISLPVTNFWLGSLWDKGYGLSRLLGLVVIGYVVWLLGSFGWLSFGLTTVWLVLFAWIGINFVVASLSNGGFWQQVRDHWALWVRLEVIFLLALWFWAVVRGHMPDINGLEKFMDFGFMQSVLQSTHFPPEDMWFAGGGINYYYFGHYLSGLMTLWSGIKPAVAYNLMMAVLFALTILGGVSVGGALFMYHVSRIKYQVSGRRWMMVAGLLAAFLLAVRGNLHWAGYQLNTAIGEMGWHEYVKGGPTTVGDKKDFDCESGVNWLPCPDAPYWYPDATRYIPFTIHEFPLYSFVVADLHAHVINLPLVLLFLGGVLELVKRIEGREKKHSRLKVIEKLSALIGSLKRTPASPPSESGGSFPWWMLGVLGFLLGIFAMTNAWDVPIYGMVLGMSLLLVQWVLKPSRGRLLAGVLISGLLMLLWLYMSVVVADDVRAAIEAGTLELEISTLSLGERLAVFWSYALDTRLTWWVILMTSVLGGWWLMEWMKDRQKKQSEVVRMWSQTVESAFWVIVALGIGIVVSLPFQLQFEQIAEGVRPVLMNLEWMPDYKIIPSDWTKLMLLWGWDLFLFVSLGVFLILQRKKTAEDGGICLWDWIVLGFYSIGWLLIVVPEMVFLKDIYINDYHRANTVFKLVYQSWTLFAIGGSYTIVRLATAGQNQWHNSFLKYGWVGMAMVGLVAVGSYPSEAIKSFYNSLKEYKGLDGEVWLERRHPDDYAGIVWLRELEGQPLVLEAVGDSYTEFNRVSAYTGYPTVQGWLVHEWLWRGGYDEPGARRAAVEFVYNAEKWDDVTAIDNLAEEGTEDDNIYNAKELLTRYGVAYVFVGDKEREQYPDLLEEKFKEIGELVFEQGETRIYQISN